MSDITKSSSSSNCEIIASSMCTKSPFFFVLLYTPPIRSAGISYLHAIYYINDTELQCMQGRLKKLIQNTVEPLKKRTFEVLGLLSFLQRLSSSGSQCPFYRGCPLDRVGESIIGGSTVFLQHIPVTLNHEQ